MRPLALLFTVVLAGAPVAAGQSATSSEKATPSPAASEKTNSDQASGPAGQTQAADPAVSLDKIREGLSQPPSEPLKGLDEQAAQEAAHFKVQVEERRKIVELLSTLDFKSGPTPAGGIYANELQRIQHPPIDEPLMQPYAAFSTGELLTIAIENLMGRYLAGRAIDAVSAAERAHAEAAARDEVGRAMADFCAAQPDQGAGLQACAVVPTSH
jgi:hypothetical protein